MKKKNDLVVILIIIATILVIGYLIFFNIKKNTKVEITALVTHTGNNYIIVVDEEDNEYQLNTTKDYEIGDKIKATIKNIKNNSPKKCELVKIDIISKTVELPIDEEINEDIEENIVDNTTTNQETSNEIINDNTDNSNNQNNNINNNETNKNETPDVVAYVSDYYNDLTNDKITEKTIKERFVTLVDFIFYDGKINNTTFKELTTETKLKVLHFFLKIDSKIEEKFPNYKSTISSTGNKIYTNAKTKALELYLNTTTEVCSNNESVCETAKEGLKDLKNNFSLTFDFIKTIAGKGVDKLAGWYKIWKEI